MLNIYEIVIEKSKSKYPKISQIISGLKKIDYCKSENAFCWVPDSKLEVQLWKNKGQIWPDFLHDYHWHDYYIFSERFYEMLNSLKYVETKSYGIDFNNDIPDKLKNTKPPKYFVMNTEPLHGAEIDYKKSKLANYTYCKECKTLRISVDDIVKKINAGIKGGMYIDEKSWDGKELFSIGRKLYCTKEFIDIIKSNKITNMSFRNIENDKYISGI